MKKILNNKKFYTQTIKIIDCVSKSYNIIWNIRVFTDLFLIISQFLKKKLRNSNENYFQMKLKITCYDYFNTTTKVWISQLHCRKQHRGKSEISQFP